MEDNEKNRAEYVTRLETVIKNLQEQLAAAKQHEKWVPQIGGELSSSEQKGRITISLGGKNQTAVFSYDFLRNRSTSDAATEILESGFTDFVLDRLRPVIEPELERLKKSADSITKAGQW